jgi:hypothetical protein
LKRSIVFAVLIVFGAAAANAAQLSAVCTPTGNFAGGSGSVDTVCPSFNTLNGGVPGPGYVLNFVQIEYFGSISLGLTSGTNSVGLTFNPAAVGAGWTNDPTGPITVSCVGIGCSASMPGQPLSSLAIAPTFADFASSFTVNLASSPLSGSVNNSDMFARIIYDYTDAPEPATLAMLGAGLVTLALLRRRIRA